MKSWTTKNGYKITRILAGRSNVFLVEGKGKNILVDTSPGYKRSKLYSILQEMGISNLDYLILTHTHFDHAANAARVRRRTLMPGLLSIKMKHGILRQVIIFYLAGQILLVPPWCGFLRISLSQLRSMNHAELIF